MDQTIRQTNDLISQMSSIVYKTTASDIGSKAESVSHTRPIHGINGKFSKALASAGMPQNNSLNTGYERDRYLDYCKDWQEKNI